MHFHLIWGQPLPTTAMTVMLLVQFAPDLYLLSVASVKPVTHGEQQLVTRVLV
jgi:hypothetical protein